MPNFTAFVDGVDNVDAAAINLRFTELDNVLSNLTTGVTPLALINLTQGLDLTSQGSDPASPGSGKVRVYNKSNVLHLKDSSGNVYKMISAESNGQTIITATLDALTAGTANTHLHLRRLTNSNGVGIGISFSVSADPNFGGKFLLNRTGTNSKGRFEFWLKDNTSSGDTTVLKFVMHEGGAFDQTEIADPGTPASGFGRSWWTTGGERKATNDAGVQFTMGGPGCLVHSSTNQTVTAGVFTLLTWDTEIFDTNNWYDTSTNRFTPQVAGKYLCFTMATMAGAASGTTQISIYKNAASAVAQGYGLWTASEQISIQALGVVDMNGSTDFLSVYITAQVATITKTFQRANFLVIKVG
jgi:uncharacterized protein YgiB involved in biofilm formation